MEPKPLPQPQSSAQGAGKKFQQLDLGARRLIRAGEAVALFTHLSSRAQRLLPEAKRLSLFRRALDTAFQEPRQECFRACIKAVLDSPMLDQHRNPLLSGLLTQALQRNEPACASALIEFGAHPRWKEFWMHVLALQSPEPRAIIEAWTAMLAERRGISSLEEGLKFLDQERETLRKQAIGAGFGKPARRSTREAMIQEGRAIFESAILLCSTQSAPSKPQSPAKRALTL